MGSVMAGQVASMITEVQSCEEIVQDVIKGTEMTLKKFC